MYKNATITRRHIELVVRKAWILYLKWYATQHTVDGRIYHAQRKLAENAIAAGNPAWKEEFPLP